MYRNLLNIHRRPAVWSVYTADVLWTAPHLAGQMLQTHFSQDTVLASRRTGAIEHTVNRLDNAFGLEGKSVLDLGCGPGLYAERFARLGARVCGIDFSANSIAYAREHGCGAVTYRIGNYLHDPFPVDQDLVTLIYCDLCALSPAQRQTLLGKIRNSLKPDGRFVLDVASMSAFATAVEASVFAHNYMDGFWSVEDYFAFHHTFRYEDDAVTLDRFTIVEEARTWDVYNWLQYFDEARITRELTDSGLDVVEIIAGFDDDPADATTFGVIAKPSQ